MTINELIGESANLIRWLDCRMNGLPLSSEPKVRYSAGSFMIALEHQRGIVTLIANLHYTTARTVMRPLFEVYARGLWLKHCATQRDIERFEKHDIGLNFGGILEAVEAIEGFESKRLSEIKVRYWKAMNAYVHSRFQQIVRHQTEDSIEAVNDPDEAKDILVFANVMGCMSAISTADLAHDDTLANEMVERMGQLWSPGPETGSFKAASDPEH